MTNTRLKWLDAAKGIAIILVVLHHSILWLDKVDLVHPVYVQIDHFMKQARMPLFFLASGIALKYIYQKPPSEFVAYKLLPIAWIYMVWTVICGIAFDDVLSLPFLGGESIAIYFAKAMVQPTHGLWFVLALGVMCFLALITRQLPSMVVLAGTLAMTLYNDMGLHPAYFPIVSDAVVHNILNYCLFFFVGLFFSDLIIKEANSRNRMLALLGLSFIGFIIANWLAFQSEALFWQTQTVRAVCGTAIGFAVSVLLTRIDQVGSAMSWMGKRSLGIFLGHGLFLVPIVVYMPEAFRGAETLQTIAPILATALCVGGATALYLLLSRIGLRWIYIFPKDKARAIVESAYRVVGRRAQIT